MSIRLLDFGRVPAVRSQSVYHAVSHAWTPTTPDTIILVSPDRPYVCTGYHQDVAAEVDLDYCRAAGLPVYRREVGGGAVYLDDGQVFVQWVFGPGNLPGDLSERFSLFAQPLVETYQRFGIPAYHRPVNDIHVAGQKIGGTGAAQIGPADVVVGSLMFRFDKATMARVLKVASEKMRDKIVAGLEQYMTTMAEQLGAEPDHAAVVGLYLERAAAALDREVVPGEWTRHEEAVAVELDERLASAAWLFERRRAWAGSVKIHEDVHVAEAAYKAAGGLIRATVQVAAGQVSGVSFSGDFTLLPADALAALESAAVDCPVDAAALTGRFAALYREHGVNSPGVTPEDFASAVMAAARQ